MGVSDVIMSLGQVGANQSATDGAQRPPALSKRLAALATNISAKYYLDAKAGRIFHASTAVTGVAPGTAIGTTAAFSLYNPVGSGVDLVILEASMGYVSGTLGAGVIDYVANIDPSAAATTGTAITKVNAYLGGTASAARAFTTATIPAPTVVRPFASLTASLASTAVAPFQIIDIVDGQIIVSPGCTISLHGTAAAGSTPLVVFGMTWCEEPV